MKLAIYLVVSLSLIALPLFGCASPAPTTPAVYTEDKTDISVPAGKQFILELKANPTTGYTWSAGVDQAAIKVVKNEYKQDESKPGMVGVGGTDRWTFEALKAGKSTITMTYKQNWQGGQTGQTKTFNITAS